MNRKRRWISKALVAAVLMLNGIGVLAQEQTGEKSKIKAKAKAKAGGEAVWVETHTSNIHIDGDHIEVLPGGAVANIGDHQTFTFVSSEMSMDGKVVKGAPYSGEAISESVRILADGNRIVRKSSAMVYRDSEGRTRREHAVNAIGTWTASGSPPRMISINDPVSGINYILDPEKRTARKVSFHRFTMTKRPAGQAGDSTSTIVSTEVRARVGGGGKLPAPVVVTTEVPAPMIVTTEGGAKHVGVGGKHKVKPNVEQLGKQMIEGVEAEGTRTTITIAAGEIGNEQPINIVSERWYSPELQVVVMTKRNDPQFGETTYRLANINRSEPARSLFEVPSDYTINESHFKTVEKKARPKDKEEQ